MLLPRPFPPFLLVLEARLVSGFSSLHNEYTMHLIGRGLVRPALRSDYPFDYFPPVSLCV